MARVGIGENIEPEYKLDYSITFNCHNTPLHEDYLAIVSVVPAQMIGFFKSLNLCLKPDTPSVSGTITRVVEGVEIYPFTKNSRSNAMVDF